MLRHLLSLLTPADWAALITFMTGWIGYGWFADRAARGARGLRGVTHALRLEWGRQMVRRENRITDSSLVGNLMTSVSFYANTTIYIIAGLIAVAGTLDKLMSFTEDLPFARADEGASRGESIPSHRDLHLRVLQVHLVATAIQFPVDPDRRCAATGRAVRGARAERGEIRDGELARRR